MGDLWTILKLCEVEGTVEGITKDNNGNIYFTTGNKGLWKWTSSETKPQLLYQDLHGTDMLGVVWDGDDSLYICDWKHKILKYSIESGMIITLVGKNERVMKDGNFEDATFTYPNGITMDNYGILYITDYHHIRKLDIPNRTVETIAGSPDSANHLDGEAKHAKFHHPTSLFVDTHGTLYIRDTKNYCIRIIKDGQVSTIITSETESVFLKDCNKRCGFLLDFAENLIVIADNGFKRVPIDLIRLTATKEDLLGLKESSFLCSDGHGNILIGTKGRLLLLHSLWSIQRLLWIGNLKEDEKNCFWAKVPKDLIREIITLVMPINHKKRPTSTEYNPIAKRSAVSVQYSWDSKVYQSWWNT